MSALSVQDTDFHTLLLELNPNLEELDWVCGTGIK